MDINLLLSPEESTSKSPPPPTKVSEKKTKKQRSSKVVNSSNSGSNNDSNNDSNNSSISNSISNRNNISNSNFSNGAHTDLSPPSLPHSLVAQAQYVMPSPPLLNVASALRVSATGTPAADGNRAMRQPSTPRMDTLADLASMQHHQQTTRASAGGLRSAEVYENQSSSTSAVPHLHAMSRAQGSVRGSVESLMVDPPTQTPSPRHYSVNSLTEAQLQTIAQLVTYLTTNPFAYESHVQLVKLLHQGLVSYTDPQLPSTARGDPHMYDLLQDLRNAREAMNATFALGEDLWVDWIEDQQLLAKTLDHRITVIESCQKALDEESGSTRLWLLYADWMLSMYISANPQDQRALDISKPTAKEVGYSEEDVALAQSVCSWQQMLEVWRQGVQDTKWRINDSHLLWDRYTELLMQDLGRSPSHETISAVKSHFIDRLQTPHGTWDQTFQMFSGFVSQYDNLNYEETMIAANRQGSDAKVKYALREFLEIKLRRASEESDRDAERKAFSEYIDWEMTQSRKGKIFSFELLNALYQRATLRFPTDTSLWEGFVMFINDEIISFGQEITALPVLNRATNHCPWSGTLWSQYLLVAERDNQPFPTMHNIKHKATSTGLLDAGDMPEVLKVYTAWCGFLRRHAFHDDSTDEDMDVAEVGIRSAIEDMETLGREKYGKNYQGDPEYRLQRIYIKYLSQCCNWEGARNAWKGLIATQGDSYDFWLRYYLWEMSTWGQLAYSESALNGSQPTKLSYATQVLQHALQRPKLDWPEKILETFQHHCEDHEDIEGLQAAVIQIWKARKVVATRREREAFQALEATSSHTLLHQEAPQADPVDSGNGFKAGKRKRGDGIDGSEIGTPKKHRLEVSDGVKSAPGEAASSIPKRDRENSTVIVRNLPYGTTETRVRQYFRDVGSIPISKFECHLTFLSAAQLIA
jgi:squamous cell carcinoma antigen recognized by T-cells 3